MRKSLTIGGVAVLIALSALADDRDRNRNNDGNNHNNGNSRLQSGMVGSAPGTTVGGVPSGAFPWIVNEAEASISGSGRLQVEVSGLLIASGPGVPANVAGTVGPVQMVAASVVCGGSGGAVAAGSDGTPLSARGDAQIDAQITLPQTCMAPVVLVRVFNPVGSQPGPFIAVTGLSAFSGGQQNGDNGGGR
jgi:hypothetical protein